MATEALVRQLMERVEGNPDASTVAVLRELMNDSTIESSSPPLSIAQAAKLLNTSVYTLRYYEREGLVHPDRNAKGYRVYSAFALRRLVFLSRMRVSGMTMSDLKRYISLVEQGDATIGQRRQLMLEQRRRIQAQINELSLALEVTDYKIESYHAALPSTVTPA